MSYALLVLALAGEGKLVLWLSVGDLVDTEPLVCGPQKTREVPLDILDIVQLGSQWVVDVDDDDLPVGLLLVKESHDAQNLDLLNLPGVSDKLADLADVQWVVIALGLGLRVDGVGVFPGLSSKQFNQLLMFVSNKVDDNSHGGMRRSSRDNPCGGSSCGRIEACPSSRPA